MDQKIQKLSESCVDSISNDNRLRNLYQKSDDATRRTILTAWYEGHRSGVPMSERDVLPTLENFLNEVTPKAKQAIAA